MLCHVLCQVTAFLSSCQHPQGGYGGGPGQLAHLAPTYAAASALLTLGGQEALSSIDRCVHLQAIYSKPCPGQARHPTVNIPSMPTGAVYGSTSVVAQLIWVASSACAPSKHVMVSGLA
jgi:prenyltransferase beta subunit